MVFDYIMIVLVVGINRDIVGSFIFEMGEGLIFRCFVWIVIYG